LANEETDEQIATRLLNRFKEDLIVLACSEPYQAWPDLVTTGLLRVAGLMLHRGVQLEPDARRVLLQQIDQLRARVSGQAGRTTAPN